jgi:phosphatidate phosphatase APP1
MNREMTGNAHQAFSGAGELLPLAGQVQAAEVRMGRDQLRQPPFPIFKKGNAAGDLPDFTSRAAVDLGNFAERTPGLKTVVIGDHGGVQPGIPTEYVFQHLIAFVPGKVEVDIRRVSPLQVQETLEYQFGGDRIDMGDAQAVAHD